MLHKNDRTDLTVLPSVPSALQAHSPASLRCGFQHRSHDLVPQTRLDTARMRDSKQITDGTGGEASQKSQKCAHQSRLVRPLAESDALFDLKSFFLPSIDLQVSPSAYPNISGVQPEA